MARYSASATASGAAKGAATGTEILPGWGTAIGATVGGLQGFFGSRTTRKSRAKAKKIEKGKDKYKGPGGYTKLPTMDPLQQMLHREQARGLFGKGKFRDQFKFDKENPLFRRDKQAAEVYKYKPNKSIYQFDQNNPLYNYDANLANQTFNQTVAAPAYQQFAENVIPSITGQFRGNNLQNSSYLGGALGKAATDVQKNLDAQRANMIYAGTEAANQRRYEGFQTAQNRQYEGFNQARAAEYASRNQAFNRKYQGYLDVNKNRANTLENILDRTTFDYGRPEAAAPGVIDTLFNAAAPSLGKSAGDWLSEYFKADKEGAGDLMKSKGGTGNGTQFNFVPPGG